jgi:hypothetical protein
MRAAGLGGGAVQALAAAIATYAGERPGHLYAGLSLFAAYLADQCIQCDTLGQDDFFRPVEIDSAEDWHRFLFDCLTALVATGLAKQSVTWSAWCTQLKKVLKDLAPVHCPNPTCEAILKELLARNHRAPTGQAKEQVAAEVPVDSPSNAMRRLATIHEVKGETHDLTMLVSSSRQGEQSHWKEWLADPASEAARFAYVASSRPRHILIWAVKSLRADERKQLMSLGFHQFVAKR